MRRRCLLCRQVATPSHVEVLGVDGLLNAGPICGHHTLAETVLRGSGVLELSVAHYPDRITLVGQAPGPGSRSSRPFDGPTGDRLAKLAGLASYEDLARRACLVNVFPRRPGASGKGCAFPLDAARRRAAKLVHGLARARSGKRRILFVGRAVASAFAIVPNVFSEAKWVDVVVRGDDGLYRPITAATIPHPSGVNHVYNDRATRAAVSQFLKEAFRDA